MCIRDRLKISWDTLTKASDDAAVEENNKTVAAGLDTEAVDITDKKTKVRIKASKNVLVNGVKLKVTQLKSGSKYNKVKKALSGIGDKITAVSYTHLREQTVTKCTVPQRKTANSRRLRL